MIYASVSPSGAGKSFYYNQNYRDSEAVLVCPDDIRKEITGSISDQSKNKEVFELAYKRLNDFLKEGKDVYFSATSLAKKSRDDLIEIAEKNNTFVCFILFKRGLDCETCFRSVKDDLSRGIERSDTTVLDEEKHSVVWRQCEKYKEVYKSIKKEMMGRSNVAIVYV